MADRIPDTQNDRIPNTPTLLRRKPISPERVTPYAHLTDPQPECKFFGDRLRQWQTARLLSLTGTARECKLSEASLVASLLPLRSRGPALRAFRMPAAKGQVAFESVRTRE
jgi:hypothetical protein